MEMLRGLTMQLVLILFMMLIFWPGGGVTGQLLPEPIVDTQYGQILGNRRLFEGTIAHCTVRFNKNEINFLFR